MAPRPPADRDPKHRAPGASNDALGGASDDPRTERAEAERNHTEDLLDEALGESFPASDPISVPAPRKKSARGTPAQPESGATQDDAAAP